MFFLYSYVYRFFIFVLYWFTASEEKNASVRSDKSETMNLEESPRRSFMSLKIGVFKRMREKDEVFRYRFRYLGRVPQFSDSKWMFFFLLD